MWIEALNQAEVEASFAFRRAENVYYPPAIRALGLSSTSGPRADIVSKEDAGNEASPAKILPSSNSPRKDTEQAKAFEKVKDTTKGEWFLRLPSPKLDLRTLPRANKLLRALRLF